MHEWALAEAVVEAALQEAGKDGLKEITGIKVTLGELQQIERDVFGFALEEIVRQSGPLASKATIDLSIETALFRCRPCAREWDFAGSGLSAEEAESVHFIPEVAHVFMRCPGCGSPDFEVARGRGVWVSSIDGVT